MRGFDDDVRSHLAGEIEKRGIRVVLGCQHTTIEKTATGLLNTFWNGHEIETDVVMFATGRDAARQGSGAGSGRSGTERQRRDQGR